MPMCKLCGHFFEIDDFTNPDDGEGSPYCPDCVESGECYRDDSDEEDQEEDELLADLMGENDEPSFLDLDIPDDDEFLEEEFDEED